MPDTDLITRFLMRAYGQSGSWAAEAMASSRKIRLKCRIHVWSKDESVSKAGQSSCLLRVVIMNKRFLRDEVPNEALDYCLLHEVANITIDFGIDIP